MNPTSAPCAAVDVGSNTVRLLVVDADGHALTRLVEITRLGRGVDATGLLDDQALADTLAVLATYRRAWESFSVGAVRIAATSAVRDADDRDRFFEGVRDVTGHDAEVLTGGEEAALAFAGARPVVADAGGPVLVVDIGGGSTELIVGDARPGAGAPTVTAAVSLQLGSVRLLERLLPSDPATADELAAARAEVRARLAQGTAVLRAGGADVATVAAVVGVAGTVTTLAMLHLGLPGWQDGAVHGSVLAADDVAGLASRLCAMTAAQRRALPGVPPGRADVIAAGAVILDEVARVVGTPRVIASESDILDGLAASLRAAAP